MTGASAQVTSGKLSANLCKRPLMLGLVDCKLQASMPCSRKHKDPRTHRENVLETEAPTELLDWRHEYNIVIDREQHQTNAPAVLALNTNIQGKPSPF